MINFVATYVWASTNMYNEVYDIIVIITAGLFTYLIKKLQIYVYTHNYMQPCKLQIVKISTQQLSCKVINRILTQFTFHYSLMSYYESCAKLFTHLQL